MNIGNNKYTGDGVIKLLLMVVVLYCVMSMIRMTEAAGCSSCTGSQQCCTWVPPGKVTPINQCYNPTNYQCPLDPARSLNCLCPSSAPNCCNAGCYNPTRYFCTPTYNNPDKWCLCQTGVHTDCYYSVEEAKTRCAICNSIPVVTVTATPGCGSSTLTCSATGVTGTPTYLWIASGGGVVPPGESGSPTITVTDSGTYTCKVYGSIARKIQNGRQCPGYASKTVTITSGVTTSITTVPSPPTTCDEEVTLTCSVTGGTGTPSYLWTNDLNGDTETTAEITVSDSATYTCTATVDGCSDDESVVVDVDDCPNGPCLRFTLLIAPEFGSTENTGAAARLTFAFSQEGTDTKLTLTIENLTDGSRGLGATEATLVGVAFDSPGDVFPDSYDDNSSGFDKLWQDPSLPPYGTYDIGISPDRMSFPGGNPTEGLEAGDTITVYFTFDDTDATVLGPAFYNGYVADTLAAVGRFQQVNAGGGSDKVLAGDPECLDSVPT